MGRSRPTGKGLYSVGKLLVVGEEGWGRGWGDWGGEGGRGEGTASRLALALAWVDMCRVGMHC